MDPWMLTASEPTAEPLYLANGYLGTAIQGDSGLQLESEPCPCYVRGVYDHSDPDRIDHLALLPCWSRVRYGAVAQVQSYERQLDLRHGILTTRVVLREARGDVQIEQRVFVSRAEQHQAVVSIAMRPSFSGEIAWLAGLESPADTNFEILDSGGQACSLWLRGNIPAYDIDIAEVLTFQGSGWTISPDAPSSSGIGCRLTALATTGDTLTLTQLVSVATSLEMDDPLAMARWKPPDCRDVQTKHIEAWERLWQTDIEIDGDPEVQQYVRAAMYYLWSTVREDDRWSIAPMGLSSNGYNGHIFWDAELWMYPSLLVTQPALAQSCVSYREHTMEAARRRAATNGYHGTQFPWEGAFTGDEMTPYWADTRDFQLHITADVAIGAWWYYLNTRDCGWLREHGYPLMRECAEFWVSRVEHNAQLDRYEISDVVCADEYAAHVNNDAFTNAAVRLALLLTDQAAHLVNEPACSEWRDVAEKMYVPYDSERRIHIEYDGFDGQLTKQADVELLAYPLEYCADPAQVARDLDYYATVIDPDGPAMSFSVYAILSAQLGRPKRAYQYLLRSFMPNCRLPFWCFSETPANNEYLFCTGIGGSLQAILFGFTGLRLREGWFALQPVLPPHWPALRLRNLFVSGARVDIEIEPDRCLIRRMSTAGTVAVRAERCAVDAWKVSLIEGSGELRVESVDSGGSPMSSPSNGRAAQPVTAQRVRVARGDECLLDVVLS